MHTYVAKACGWMAIIDAQNHREAVAAAKRLAPSCSLLPSDITAAQVGRATQADIDWHAAMSGRS